MYLILFPWKPSAPYPLPGLTLNHASVSLLKQLPTPSSISTYLFLWCSLGKSRCHVFVKVVQPVWSTTRERTLFCRLQGPAFTIRLCSMFGSNVWNRNVGSTSVLLLHKPSGNLLIRTAMYFSWARISAGCLFETHLSVLDLCLTHCWGSQPLGKVTGSCQSTYLVAFLVFPKSDSDNAPDHKDDLWSSKHSVANPWPSMYRWILVRTLYTAQSHIKVIYKCKFIYEEMQHFFLRCLSQSAVVNIQKHTASSGTRQMHTHACQYFCGLHAAHSPPL